MLWFLPGVAAIAGLLADFISGGIANLVGLTGLLAGAAHYGAILAGLPPRKIERVTGIGFFVGAGLGFATIAMNVFV